MEKEQNLSNIDKTENAWSVDVKSRVTDIMRTLAILGVRGENPSCDDEFDKCFDESTGYDKLVKSEQVVQDREIFKQEFIKNFSGGENGARRDEFRYNLNLENYRKFYKIKNKCDGNSKEEA